MTGSGPMNSIATAAAKHVKKLPKRGHIYLVTGSGAQRSYQVLRKPDRIQERLWKEIYPMRRRVRGDAAVLTSFSPSPRDKWSEDGDSLIVDTKDKARAFLQDQDLGL